MSGQRNIAPCSPCCINMCRFKKGMKYDFEDFDRRDWIGEHVAWSMTASVV
jgi:hypothetical protein